MGNSPPPSSAAIADSSFSTTNIKSLLDSDLFNWLQLESMQWTIVLTCLSLGVFVSISVSLSWFYFEAIFQTIPFNCEKDDWMVVESCASI